MNILGISITRTNAEPKPDYSNMTLQEQFQERYGKTAVNDLFAAFAYVKRAILVVTLVAIGISYFHQQHYFESRGAGVFSWVIPISIDCVMLVFMKISQLAVIRSANRWIARAILVIPAAGSMLINFMATSDDVLRWVYVGVVAAIVICEIGHGLMVPHLASMERKAAQLAPAVKVDTPPVPARRRVTQQERNARRRAGYAKMTTAEKAAWTKAYARRTGAVAPASPGRVPVPAPSAEQLELMMV